MFLCFGKFSFIIWQFPLFSKIFWVYFLSFGSTFWENDLTLAFLLLISKYLSCFMDVPFLTASCLFYWCTILSSENIHYTLKLFLALGIVCFFWVLFSPIYLFCSVSFRLEIFLKYLKILGYSCVLEWSLWINDLRCRVLPGQLFPLPP